MDPTSNVFKNFTCGEKKAMYITVFGIAPYFNSVLKGKFLSATEYSLLFDESLNKDQKKNKWTYMSVFGIKNKYVNKYLLF